MVVSPVLLCLATRLTTVSLDVKHDEDNDDDDNGNDDDIEAKEAGNDF